MILSHSFVCAAQLDAWRARYIIDASFFGSNCVYSSGCSDHKSEREFPILARAQIMRRRSSSRYGAVISGGAGVSQIKGIQNVYVLWSNDTFGVQIGKTNDVSQDLIDRLTPGDRDIYYPVERSLYASNGELKNYIRANPYSFIHRMMNGSFPKMKSKYLYNKYGAFQIRSKFHVSENIDVYAGYIPELHNIEKMKYRNIVSLGALYKHSWDENEVRVIAAFESGNGDNHIGTKDFFGWNLGAVFLHREWRLSALLGSDNGGDVRYNPMPVNANGIPNTKLGIGYINGPYRISTYLMMNPSKSYSNDYKNDKTSIQGMSAIGAKLEYDYHQDRKVITPYIGFTMGLSNAIEIPMFFGVRISGKI